MDKTTPIAPVFAGDLGQSAAALCDFFLIANEAAVPVTKFTIMADGAKCKVSVAPGKQKTALFLLYCAVLKQAPYFAFDASLKDSLRPFFGDQLVADAERPQTTHTALRPLVIGRDVQVGLSIQSGYDLPQAAGRTVRKLIEHGWGLHQKQAFTPETPVPLIRAAVTQFMKADQAGQIRIVPNWDPDVWPSMEWQERVWTLKLKLGML